MWPVSAARPQPARAFCRAAAQPIAGEAVAALASAMRQRRDRLLLRAVAGALVKVHGCGAAAVKRLYRRRNDLARRTAAVSKDGIVAQVCHRRAHALAMSRDRST